MKNNILLDRLPNITPHGLKIRTDFRESIKFELLIQDNNINQSEKLIIALNLFYYEMPSNIEQAVEDLIWFYKCGKNDDLKIKKNNNRSKQIYSYEFDENYIYTAFLQQYNIDLNKIKHLHWWKFRAMFDGLNKDTRIVEIMGYRAISLNSIKDKDEKKRIKKLKELYKLPDMRTKEQKESDFGRAFW